MTNTFTHQMVISGVGGQGVLFVTRLLAEAAIAKRCRYSPRKPTAWPSEGER